MLAQIQHTTAQYLGAVNDNPPLLLLPVIGARARLGFPSPADDFLEDSLDLNQLLIRNPASTFLYRAEGDSMLGVGIRSGDILVVDRSVSVRNGDKVLACWGGDAPVCKILRGLPEKILLYSANPDFPVLEPGTDAEVELFAIVGCVRVEIRERPRRVRAR